MFIKLWCQLYVFVTSIAVFLFLVPQNAKAQTGLYYRSIASGNWSDITCWEVSTNAGFSTPLSASMAPSLLANTITIQNGHTISIITSVVIDEVVVDKGGNLILTNTSLINVNVNNGSGTDLWVNGTLEDHMSASVTWTAGAKWKAGSQSTFIKTSGSSATSWQTSYEGGPVNIPSTHLWIYRKQTTDNPSVTLAGAYYGNLRFDNTTGTHWDATGVTSKLTGSATTGIIKGKFTIGDRCKIYMENSASQLLLIQSDFEIKPLGEFVLNTSLLGGARGLEIQGNMTINGSLAFNFSGANDVNRIIQFSGAANQVITGTSPLIFYNFIINKPSGKVIMSTDVTVTNTITFTSGILDLDGHVLSLTNGSANALLFGAGGIYAEDVLFKGQFRRTISDPNSVYLFPFVINTSSVALTLRTSALVNNEVVTASTYGTSHDNLPLAQYNDTQVDLPFGNNDVFNEIADRYWWIDAPSTLDVANLSITFAPDDLNALVTLWDIIFNANGTAWDKIIVNGQGLVLNSLPVSGVTGIWTAIKNSVSLGFKPSQNHFTNAGEKLENEIADIDIYSLEGKRLKNVKQTSVANEIRSLTTGVYFLRVIYDDHAETLKIGLSGSEK